jgi:hypothetical protein
MYVEEQEHAQGENMDTLNRTSVDNVSKVIQIG